MPIKWSRMVACMLARSLCLHSIRSH
ncbi:hypothetical protein Zm00014a_004759 [Zea mays]|uniref:Uncharacterized protein n=1 Tax=Zea mays TaxID=4577 RepID=A0A317YJH7_MAIZE|nr:hypothetical protein Zm00014a_004759 [Zea mays]